jgi:hypothetical protein
LRAAGAAFVLALLAVPLAALAVPLAALAAPLVAVAVPLAVPADRELAEPAALALAIRAAAAAEVRPSRPAGRVAAAAGRAAVPAVEVLAAAERERSELCVATAVPVAGAVALAAPAGVTTSQFRNMKYCWPSVHTFVVTQ